MCLNRLGKLEIPILSALPGTPGEPGDDGNIWLSGVGEPTAQLGSINDYYLDTSTNTVWNKISSTTWEIITNLTGPEGPEGPVSTEPSTVPGPQGAAGATVIINGEGNNTNTTTYLTMSGNSNQIPAGLVDQYDILVFDIGIQFFHDYVSGNLQKQANFRFTIFGSSITGNPVTSSLLENSITSNANATTTGRLRVSLNRIGNFNTIVSVNFSDALGNAIAYNPVNASLNYDNAIPFAIEGKLGFAGQLIGTSFIKCTDYTLTIFKYQS
jgi:hypothetical protein